MRCLCPAAIVATLCLSPALALAEECPDGDWFCDSSGTPPEYQDGGPEAEPEGAEAPAGAPEGEKAGAPVVVYTPKGEPKPSSVIVVETPAPQPPTARKKVKEWGFNLHLSAALLGDDPKADEDAGMGGLGFSFRYRPVPVFALDAGMELIGGTDWNGYDRSETGFLVNAMVFFNPRDKFQIFWFGGFGGSKARVQVEDESGVGTFEEQYGYFGVQSGFGVEARVSKKVAIGADLLGFVRGRTDVRANARPEFVDPETHRATNGSGGGLLRGGVTFYW